MQAFLSGGTPDCQELTMEKIDSNNNKSTETHYVTKIDIKNMNPCSFSDGKNPVSGVKCKNAFQNYNDDYLQLPEDTLAQIYFGSLTIIGVYIFIKLMEKANKLNIKIK